MVLKNSDTLRLFYTEAQWRSGDDNAQIEARFASFLRDTVADEDLPPCVRMRAHEDMVTIATRCLNR